VDTCSVWWGRGWADVAWACPCGWMSCGRYCTGMACHCCGSPYASSDTARSWNSFRTSGTRSSLQHANSIIKTDNMVELSQSKSTLHRTLMSPQVIKMTLLTRLLRGHKQKPKELPNPKPNLNKSLRSTLQWNVQTFLWHVRDRTYLP